MALIDEMDTMDIWRFWTNNHVKHDVGCYARIGYPYECQCSVPSNWVFPYEVRYTYRCMMIGIEKAGVAPPHVP